MDDAPFMLYGLPDVVLRNVVAQIDPIDVATLALLSKNSKKKIEQFRSLYIKCSIRIHFREDTLFPDVRLQTNGTQNKLIDMPLAGSHYLAQPFPLAFLWIQLIMKVFIWENTIEEIKMIGWRGDIRLVFHWAFKSAFTVQGFMLELKHIKDADLAYFLDTCRVTRVLCLQVYPSHEFQTLRLFNEPNVAVTDARWLSPFNLPLMNCKRLILKDTRFTSDHVVRLIKCWQSGLAFGRLRKLSLLGRNIDLFDILAVLPHDIVGPEIFEQIPEFIDPLYVSGAAVIRKDVCCYDGICAIIVILAENVEDTTKQFRAYFIKERNLPPTSSKL